MKRLIAYHSALTKIASAGDQTNPIHLRDIAIDVLTKFVNHDIERTTADKYNKMQRIKPLAPSGLSAQQESEWREKIMFRKEPFKNE